MSDHKARLSRIKAKLLTTQPGPIFAELQADGRTFLHYQDGRRVELAAGEALPRCKLYQGWTPAAWEAGE